MSLFFTMSALPNIQTDYYYYYYYFPLTQDIINSCAVKTIGTFIRGISLLNDCHTCPPVTEVPYVILTPSMVTSIPAPTICLWHISLSHLSHMSQIYMFLLSLWHWPCPANSICDSWLVTEGLPLTVGGDGGGVVWVSMVARNKATEWGFL